MELRGQIVEQMQSQTRKYSERIAALEVLHAIEHCLALPRMKAGALRVRK